MLSDRNATERALRGMIENDKAYDPGLETLQEAMRITEAELNSAPYRDNPRECPSYGHLCRVWEFYGSAVDIAGKVYIVDADYSHTVPDTWEMGGTDEYGTWFSVPKTTFVSTGINAVTATEEGVDGVEEGKCRVGYSLMFPEDIDAGDEEDIPGFFAFPEEVIPEFQRLSAAAINYRLHTGHPEIMQRIDAALPPESANMTRKLHRLRDVLADIEMSDETEIDWLGHYIIARLKGDTTWPYIAQLSQEIGLSDAQGETEKITLEAPLEQYVRVESFALSYTPEVKGLKGILVLAVAPGRQSNDEDNAEKIYVPLESVDNLRSVRPRRSLREQLEAQRIEKIKAVTMARITERLLEISSEPTAETPDVAEVKAPHVHRETRFERLARQQKALADIEQLVGHSRMMVYRDREEALADTHVLAQQIATIIRGAELFSVTLSAMGDGLMRPEVTYSQSGTGFSVAAETDSVIPVNPFETRTGPLMSVVPQLERLPDDGTPPMYRHNPLLLLGNPGVHLGRNGVPVPLATASVFESTLVPIANVTSTTEVAAYRVLRGRVELFEKLRERPDARSQSLADKLTRLERALYNETHGAFTGLRKVKRIQEIAAEIMAEDTDELALAAFSSLFANDQVLILAGLLSTDKGDVETQIRGKFVGLVTDHPYTDHPRLSFVLVTNDNVCRYFPADGIKGLAF